MSKLKPCPFCGSNAIIKHDDSCGYTVICFKCNAKSDRCLSQKLAVEAWNKRTEITNNKFVRNTNPEKSIAAVREWHRHNRSTYKEFFFRNFPNAQKDSDGYPKIYACLLYPQIRDKYSGDCSSCKKCWDMVKE